MAAAAKCTLRKIAASVKTPRISSDYDVGTLNQEHSMSKKTKKKWMRHI